LLTKLTELANYENSLILRRTKAQVFPLTLMDWNTEPYKRIKQRIFNNSGVKTTCRLPKKAPEYNYLIINC
jgi:hypothetical protein